MFYNSELLLWEENNKKNQNCMELLPLKASTTHEKHSAYSRCCISWSSHSVSGLFSSLHFYITLLVLCIATHHPRGVVLCDQR